jgi:hypothetical protein
MCCLIRARPSLLDPTCGLDDSGEAQHADPVHVGIIFVSHRGRRSPSVPRPFGLDEAHRHNYGFMEIWEYEENYA